MKFYQQNQHRQYLRSTCRHGHNYQTQSPTSDEGYPQGNLPHSPHFHKISEYDSSPSFRPKEETCPLHNRSGDQPIWEHLYNEGMRSQRELQEIYLNNQNRIDIECTFQPMIQTSKRYLLSNSSTFLQRVSAWQDSKIEKMVKQKQELTQKDLKECTFVPKIIKNYPKAPCQLGQHQMMRLQLQQRSRLSISKVSNPYYSPRKSTRSTRKCDNSGVSLNPAGKKGRNIEMERVKKMLRRQLKRINL